MTPVFPNSMTTELDSGEQRMGGRQITIVDGSPNMIIAGPDQRSRGVLIYECLMYVPGRSPEA